MDTSHLDKAGVEVSLSLEEVDTTWHQRIPGSSPGGLGSACCDEKKKDMGIVYHAQDNAAFCGRWCHRLSMCPAEGSDMKRGNSDEMWNRVVTECHAIPVARDLGKDGQECGPCPLSRNKTSITSGGAIRTVGRVTKDPFVKRREESAD